MMRRTPDTSKSKSADIKTRHRTSLTRRAEASRARNRVQTSLLKPRKKNTQKRNYETVTLVGCLFLLVAFILLLSYLLLQQVDGTTGVHVPGPLSTVLHLRSGVVAPEGDGPVGSTKEDSSFWRHLRFQNSAPRTILKDEDSSNVIDMRQLNKELAFDNPDGGAWKQGWDVQPVQVDEEHPLTVFVVPHSHCDPGWIKTFDDYFQTQTKNIISTVVKALQKDPKRKFIWAEISYFSWWWETQNDDMRQTALGLLKSGQLEFVTGGWVQPDEANSELYAMEMQLQEGHTWIKENLGEEFIPKYAWSIDPFGYSPTAAYLWQKYGFQAMLIQRVHYAVKKELAQRKHLEFYWRQTWDDEGSHDIFTHVMPFFSYDVPHTCGPDPSVCCQFDFKRTSCPWHKAPRKITEQNVRERAELLFDQYKKKAALYRSNVVLAPLGDDFRYLSTAEAEAQYTNHQKIHDYINEHIPGAHIQFGTLSDYFNAVVGTFKAPLLKGSFFTYADVNQDYWSGYFTSRVFDKALDRQLERVLYAAESMGATAQELRKPRRELSLFQHHDGVTGTAKDHVVEDYAKRMFLAIQDTQKWMLDHIQKTQRTLSEQVGSTLGPCWTAPAPRAMSENHCTGKALMYNPLEGEQTCGTTTIKGKSFGVAQLPCEMSSGSHSSVKFNPTTGLMESPIKEDWRMWQVSQGGAYLFFPERDTVFFQRSPSILNGGYTVNTNSWKRTVFEKQIPSENGQGTATVIDFVYETDLKTNNQEWFVRFSSDIQSQGVFHTDLNGFNFDTHYLRGDMPIQSQVFPMPTLASIEDDKKRLTIMSEHAQGTASLQEGSIDVWLDRRLSHDDSRGLGQGVQDNRPTRTRLRVIVETGGFQHSGEFEITPLVRRFWDELQHPLVEFGSYTSADS